MAGAECRKVRSNLRNGQVDVHHLQTCPDCRGAIEAALKKNPNTTYQGETVEEVMKNAKMVAERKASEEEHRSAFWNLSW